MSGAQDRVLRMLAMVPYLQSNAGLHIDDVAHEFGITPRQVRDDLELLALTGRGQYGGELIEVDYYALDDGVVRLGNADYMSRPLRITAQEGAALVVALRTLRASAADDQLPIVDATLAKLEAALGDADPLAVDVVVDDVDRTIRETVDQAIADGVRLDITYANETRDEQTQRLVDPRRVFTERGHLYVEAWCLKAEDLRFFRLDRIVSAAFTEDSVERHDTVAPDLSDGIFTVGPDTPYVVVRLHPTADWITEYHPVDDIGVDADGHRLVKLFGSDLAWLQRLVLRHAGWLAVVEPADLARQVEATARSALAAYDG